MTGVNEGKSCNEAGVNRCPVTYIFIAHARIWFFLLVTVERILKIMGEEIV